MSSGWAKLTPSQSGYIFQSSYDPALVAAMRLEIPSHAKKWDGIRKVWIIDPAWATKLAEIVKTYLDVDLRIPTMTGGPKQESRVITVEYIGACHDRGNGESVASGYADGDWGVIFPEKVLRDWFMDQSKLGEEQTLFAVLMIGHDASADQIKASFRRLAKLNHPDVNHEPDAVDQFKRINHAYEILSDPTKRKKYQIGLSLDANARNVNRRYERQNQNRTYHPPLRCGLVLAEGVMKVGRFWIDKILMWEDITDEQGRTMISSWPAGADQFQVKWS